MPCRHLECRALCARLQYVSSFLQCHLRLIDIRNIPGWISLLGAKHPIGPFISGPSWFVAGPFNFFKEKHRIYERAGWDIHPVISLCPVEVVLFLSDAATIKEICSDRVGFPKPILQYKAIAFLGDNIVASEGEDWKKFRKLSNPAFSERNNQLVCNATTEILLDLFNNEWKGQSHISFDNVLDLTLSIALQVIGVAGFGQNISSSNTMPPGHRLSFKSCLKIVSENVFLGILVPSWFPSVTSRLSMVRLAFTELKLYVHEMIQSRQTADQKHDIHDLFSTLLDGNASENNILTESELTSNILMFLMAGHESTAHTLCYALAMLALFSDEQEKLYQHCKSVVPADQVPRYQDCSLLKQSLAVFNEALRMFPPVIGIPKEAAKDTTVSSTTIDGQTMTFPVPKGGQIVVHTVGVHYNRSLIHACLVFQLTRPIARYWKDPETFNPDRFLGPWNRDAFLPYSAGARSCLGRKFAETEGIVCLTLLVLRYKITVTEESRFIAETFEERKARVLDSICGLTLTPKRVPLTFTRRF
ncbi:cytochrome P450 [Mycena floridula]|nr:cytochrome P450 [Mycena floridula]